MIRYTYDAETSSLKLLYYFDQYVKYVAKKSSLKVDKREKKLNLTDGEKKIQSSSIKSRGVILNNLGRMTVTNTSLYRKSLSLIFKELPWIM